MAARGKTCVDAPVAALPVAPPDEGLRGLVAVGVSAERAGWTVAQGFEAAWMLRLHGTPAHISIAAFEHAARWRQ
jgi:hypothetical protein